MTEMDAFREALDQQRRIIAEQRRFFPSPRPGMTLDSYERMRERTRDAALAREQRRRGAVAS